MTGVREPSKEFMGIGWAFPFGLDAQGHVTTASYEEDIRQAIRIILETTPGERLMRPTFGAGLRSFVFEPVNTTTINLVRTRVENALIDWEPRIDLDEVRVSPGQQRNLLEIHVAYRVRLNNSHQNLVYPFYLEEGSE